MPEVTQRVTFGTVSFSHAEVVDLINRIRTLVDTANAAVDQDPSGQLTIGDENSSLNINVRAALALEDLQGAPEFANRLEYQYFSRPAPISIVWLELYDYERRLRIAGTSSEQVAAVTGFVSNEIRRHRSYLAIDSALRSTAGFLLVVAAWLTLMAAIPATGSRRVLAIGMALAILSAVWFLPWARWLAGTAIYPNSASFAARNAAAIGLVGLVLAIVGLAATAYQIYTAPSSAAAPPSGNAPP